MGIKRNRIPRDALTSGYNTGLLALGRDCNPYWFHSKRWWLWSRGYFQARIVFLDNQQVWDEYDRLRSQ